MADDWIRDKQLDAGGTATAVPTDEGWSCLAARGKEAFVEYLRARGLARGESPPTRWRFVRRYRASVVDARPLIPSWRSVSQSASHWSGQTTVSAELAVLDGHFPDEPIVPGVAQLYWAETVARQAFPGYAATGEVVRLKFLKIIVPDTKLRLTLDSPNGVRVAFAYASDDSIHSSGILVRRPL